MTLDEIRELIKLVAETKVAELEVQRGDDRVRIRLAIPAELYNSAPIYHPVPMGASHPAGTSAPAVPLEPAAPGLKADKSSGPPSDGTVLVKSPIVGTFYECS